MDCTDIAIIDQTGPQWWPVLSIGTPPFVPDEVRNEMLENTP
jgi:hypothetical protein